jgi:chromate transporter
MPSSSLLLRVWVSIGIQSFGGGIATLALIRRAVVDNNHWLTEAEFTRDWALCQIAPGINLIALAILIGKRLGGAKGIAVALLGLLLPSVAITVLLTAAYSRVQHTDAVRAALRGVVPATVGLGLATAINLARPILEESRRLGNPSLLTSVVLTIAAGLAVVVWAQPVILVLCVSGVLCGFAQLKLIGSKQSTGSQSL